MKYKVEDFIRLLTPFESRIENGGYYFFIDIDQREECIFSSRFDNDAMDRYRIKKGNFFETEEEAQDKLDKILDILKK